MSTVRILARDDFPEMIRIYADAYPGVGIVSDADRARFQERVLALHEDEPTAHFYGLFRAGDLQGVMCLYDFEMNFRQVQMPAGGVGQVAVALPYKKEHIAKEMMLSFLRHFRERKVPLVALYPFRPDFYRKMGFGYGTKMDRFRLRPSAFPNRASKEPVRYLTAEDRQAVADCYHRVVDNTHGMMRKSERELRRMFEAPEHRLFGYECDGHLSGYLVFAWKKGETFILNDMHIKELIYESPQALLGLCAFLHSQNDQVRHIFVNTQDEDFCHLLLDPRNQSNRLIPDVYHETNSQGLGLMYRVVDVPGTLSRLEQHHYASHEPTAQSHTLRLTVRDSFLPENGGSTLLRAEAGRLRRLETGQADVEICIDIADLSSMLAGTARLQSLHRYGLAEISDPAFVPTLDRLFAVAQKPRCTTSF